MALMPPSPVEAINVKYSTDDERMVLLCLFFPSIVAMVPFLPHWLDHTFYKRNLFFTQVILFVKLLSISGMDWLQLMSEFSVKSCTGTNANIPFEMF